MITKVATLKEALLCFYTSKGTQTIPVIQKFGRICQLDLSTMMIHDPAYPSGTSLTTMDLLTNDDSWYVPLELVERNTQRLTPDAIAFLYAIAFEWWKTGSWNPVTIANMFIDNTTLPKDFGDVDIGFLSSYYNFAKLPLIRSSLVIPLDITKDEAMELAIGDGGIVDLRDHPSEPLSNLFYVQEEAEMIWAKYQRIIGSRLIGYGRIK